MNIKRILCDTDVFVIDYLITTTLATTNFGYKENLLFNMQNSYLEYKSHYVFVFLNSSYFEKKVYFCIFSNTFTKSILYLNTFFCILHSTATSTMKRSDSDV